MTLTTDLIRNTRALSGDTCRSIADKADLSFTTVNRAELGKTDPGIATLDAIISGAGRYLQMKAVPAGLEDVQRLDDLLDAWTIRNGRLTIDWTRFRGWLDQIGEHPERICDAIFPTPSTSGSWTVDSLLAAIAEKLADDNGLPRPAWCAKVSALQPPFEPPARRRGEIALQLKDRNLLIDTESLFRSRLFGND